MLNRSARAALSFLSEFLYQLTNAFVALVITPLIVATLGADAFGAWKIITKTTDFLTLGNLKPLGLLQLVLSKEINNEDFSYKQQQIGSAIAILILTLPFMFILSGLVFYFRNILVPVSTEISYQVDITLVLMLFFTIVSPFCQTPNHVVQGLNMQYKRFGVTSVSVFITALLQYTVVAQGYSLPWFATITYLPMFILAVVDYSIIIKYAAWFKFVQPPASEIWLFFKKNLWMLWVTVFRSVFSLADLILIGIYFGTTITAVYTLTKTLIMFLFMPAQSLMTAALPGVGDLVGRNAQKALMQLRSEQINVAIFLGFIIGMIVVFFNAPFMRLWVGDGYFGGELLSRWLMIASLIDLLVKVESVYLDASLILKKQAICLGAASIVYLGTIVLGQPFLGLNAIPIAQSISQAILIILYWVGFKECLQGKFSHLARTVVRPLFVAVVLVYSVSWISLPPIQNWIELFSQSFKVAVLAAGLGWFLILQERDRKMLMARVANVFERVNRRKSQ